MDTQRQNQSLLHDIPKKRNVNIAVGTSPQNNGRSSESVGSFLPETLETWYQLYKTHELGCFYALMHWMQ